jgi:hypothetical protein
MQALLRMLNDFRSMLGAEPFLGVIVFAISLPLIGAMLYVAFVSVASTPILFSILAIVWMTSILIGKLIKRLDEPLGKRAAEAYQWIIFLGYVAWLLRDDLIPWKGFTASLALGILFVAAFTWLFWKVRTPDSSLDQLPDYRHREML